MSYAYPGYNGGGNNNNNNNSSQGGSSGYPGATSYPGSGGHQQQPGAHSYPGASNPASQYPGASSQYPGQQQQPQNTSFSQQPPVPHSSFAQPSSGYPGSSQSQQPPASSQYPQSTSPQTQSAAPPSAAASQYPRADNSYPKVDTAYAQQHQNRQPQQSSPTGGHSSLGSYFGYGIGALPEVHESQSSADPDKPLDPYEYLESRGFKRAQIDAARHEHVDPEPDLCLDDITLRDYGGNSIFVFFKFNKFIAILISIFFCLALVNFGIYAGDQSPTFKSTPNRLWYSDFFISAYSREQRSAWLGTTIVCIIFMFFACPCYFRYIGNFTFEDENRTLSQIEEDAVALGNADDAITRFNDDGTIDVTSRYRSYGAVFLRRLISLAVFAGFIAVQVFASIGITQIESGASDAGPAFAIAVIAAVLNMLYTVMARQLTEFEKWTDIGSADKSLTMKLILFKLANVIAVYGAKEYPDDRCVYEIVGEQFLTLLFVEIVLVVPGTLVGAGLLTRYHQLYGRILGSINGDSMHMAQFEMAIEYLATIYKFYLACMGLVTFPLSTVLAIVVLFFNFWAARYRLIKVCAKPIRSTATMRGTVTVCMTLIFFATLFTPFAGAVWIMAGWSASRTKTTLFCGLTD